jgi:hypothetical protein
MVSWEWLFWVKEWEGMKRVAFIFCVFFQGALEIMVGISGVADGRPSGALG